MLPLEHSAILLIFIKLLFVVETFVLSIVEWPFTQVLLHLLAERNSCSAEFSMKKFYILVFSVCSGLFVGPFGVHKCLGNKKLYIWVYS